jgi:flavin reductase (DIM6/NTAB) family NADH-FMN oxidoreductase RutF
MDLAHATSDTEALRAVFACFPQGVCAVAALNPDGSPRGLSVSSFTPVSLSPPLISICVANTSTTWPKLRELPTLGISVLSDIQDAAGRELAAPGEDRFANLSWSATDAGAVLLEDAVAWMTGTIESELPAGDHMIVLLHLQELGSDATREPLVFHASRFRRLVEQIFTESETPPGPGSA